MTENFKNPKGFDKSGFMTYMEEAFTLDRYARELVENVLEYAQEHERYPHVDKDRFAQFVSDMLPEVEFGEVAAFCDDEILTRNGIAEKERFYHNHPSLQKPCAKRLNKREGRSY